MKETIVFHGGHAHLVSSLRFYKGTKLLVAFTRVAMYDVVNVLVVGLATLLL